MVVRRAAGLIALAGAALAWLALALPGTSPAACGATGGGVGLPEDCSADDHYVNPVKGRVWLPGRTDMGVDFMVTRKRPIRAIGAAKVLGSEKNTGWPGGHYMWYRLLTGDHAGMRIFVAETMTKMAPKGTVVSAGQQIAVAKKGGTGTEWGWAQKDGQPRAAPCYREGMKTNSGKQFARFLRSLGARTADDPGAGPDYPIGKRC